MIADQDGLLGTSSLPLLEKNVLCVTDPFGQVTGSIQTLEMPGSPLMILKKSCVLILRGPDIQCLDNRGHA